MYTYMHLYIYIYTYSCIYAYMYIIFSYLYRERERERERERYYTLAKKELHASAADRLSSHSGGLQVPCGPLKASRALTCSEAQGLSNYF